jgi:hypothetical protein
VIIISGFVQLELALLVKEWLPIHIHTPDLRDRLEAKKFKHGV